MNRTQLIQQIHVRLMTLEDDREEARINDKATGDIDAELDQLRIKLKDVMNSPCPVIKDDTCES